MKQLFTILAAVLLTATVWAQSPEKMSYQAVIRNSSDALVANTQVGMQISILQGSASGTAVYVETQIPITNANGLISIEIGGGTVVSGDFATIDWANGPYFIKTEIDPVGGANYTITGTSQLLSVPYALHAKSAETLTEGINEADPVYSSSQAANITATDIFNLANLSGVNSGDQDLSRLVTKTALADSIAKVHDDIPDVSGIATNTQAIKDTAAQIRADIPNLTVYAKKNMNNESISNLANPVNAGDAATKAYVDVLLARIEALEESDLLNNGLTDTRDGSNYNVVKIGNQTWMAENLKYLPDVVGAEIGSETTPYYYVYGYEGTNVSEAKATDNYQTYGVLYNWPAAMAGSESSSSNPSGVQGICPNGWHLPSSAEWGELITFSGSGASSGKLKETGTIHWVDTNEGVTNETGFTALPGGTRESDGSFFDIRFRGYWWSTNEYEYINRFAHYLIMHSYDNIVNGEDLSKQMGHSVRCVKDNAPPPSTPTLTTSSVVSITEITAISGGNISSDGGTVVLERGVCWSTANNPTIADNKTSDGAGTGEFTSNLTNLRIGTTYYIRAYATNSVGTSYGEVVSFTTTLLENSFIDSRDGNVYQYVTIGNQVWMTENLKYLPDVVGAEIGSATTPYYYVNGYNGTNASEAKTTDNYQTYGALYNWPAAMAGAASSSLNPSEVQGICPNGWHLPSDAEWAELTTFLESESSDKLKETGISHWSSPNTEATNETGFTALPGGGRSDDGGAFYGIGLNGDWWCATESGANMAWYRDMYCNSSNVYRHDYVKALGLSVRCLKD